jgi:hypothetical protein
MRYSREYLQSLRRQLVENDLSDVRSLLAQIDARAEESRVRLERMRLSLARMDVALEWRRALIARLSRR